MNLRTAILCLTVLSSFGYLSSLMSGPSGDETSPSPSATSRGSKDAECVDGLTMEESVDCIISRVLPEDWDMMLEEERIQFKKEALSIIFPEEKEYIEDFRN